MIVEAGGSIIVSFLFPVFLGKNNRWIGTNHQGRSKIRRDAHKQKSTESFFELRDNASAKEQRQLNEGMKESVNKPM